MIRILITVGLCFSLSFTQALSAEKIPITSNSEAAILKYDEAVVLENTRSIDRAEELLKEALSLDSTFAMAYLKLAMLRDDYDLRREMLTNAMRHLDGVSDGEQLWIKGRYAFYVEGKNAEEFGYFKSLVERYPNDAYAQYLFGYMNVHHGRYDLEAAVYHLEKSIERDPNLVVSYNELAYACMAQKAFDKAQEAISGYIRLMPNHADPYDTQADLYLRRGNYLESIRAYEKVLTIDPNYPWAIIGKAANLDFLDRHSEARQTLKQLHDLQLSDYQERHKWRAFQCSYIDEGNIEGALENLMEQNKTAESKNDFHHRYFSYLRFVRLCFQTGQTKRGMETYQKWNSFVQQNSKRIETRSNVDNLKNYYLAYKALQENQMAQAVQFLDAYDSASVGISDESKILRSRIHMSAGKPDKTEAILKTLDVESNAYNMYIVAQFYKDQNKTTMAQELYRKIRDLYDLRDQDYAFVRRKAVVELID